MRFSSRLKPTQNYASTESWRGLSAISVQKTGKVRHLRLVSLSSPHVCADSDNVNKLGEIRRAREMGSRHASRAAGSAAVQQCSDGEVYELTVSRATPRHITGVYSQDMESQCPLGGRKLWTPAGEADPHNIWLHLAEIRSLCRPTSKSTGRNVHANARRSIHWQNLI